MQNNQLTPAEASVYREFGRGTPILFAPDESCGSRPGARPSQGVDWGPERQLRADFLIWLLGISRSEQPMSPQSIVVVGARITGYLDLSEKVLPISLILEDCSFETAVNLNSARTKQVSLAGSWLPGLLADYAQVEGMLDLSYGTEGFNAIGKVSLNGAIVDGQVICQGRVGRDADVSERDLVRGANTVPSGKVAEPSRVAFAADGLRARGGVHLGGEKGVVFDGQLRFIGCRSDQFHISNARFVHENGTAILAQQAWIKGSLVLDRVTTKGPVLLDSCNVGTDLIVKGCRFRRNASCENHLVSISLGLFGTSVSGEISVSGSVFDGQISLVGSRVGRAVRLDDVEASLANSESPVLHADGLRAQGLLVKRGSYIGGAQIVNAKLDDQLVFRDATLVGDGRDALCIQGTAVGQSIILGPLECKISGAVDLSWATTRVFEDDETAWPDKGELRVVGFRYESLLPLKLFDASKRLQWLGPPASQPARSRPVPHSGRGLSGSQPGSGG